MDASRLAMFNAAVDDREEVRVLRRGAGVELRVGGTQASWYQPGHAITGSVWDALASPVVLSSAPIRASSSSVSAAARRRA